MARITEFTLAALFTTLFGCGSRDNTGQEKADQEFSAQPSPATQSLPVEHPTGPVSVLADPRSSSARLEVAGGKALVRLPAGMFRVLSDSLPGFAPLPISSYDSVVWAVEVQRDSSAVLPSVVLADFDWVIGSNKADVLLRNVHQDSMFKQFSLRKEAVEQFDVGKGAIIYYLANGVLAQIPIGD